ncbi:MAG: MBL fold metallo-hydrolase [Candidatus Methanoplasma sp.]|jgi:L-ascorbate metabolism protein UlaG (beta-lactamase superfamily)|nr:MBL fold metallo-hydrolase [Candidatus Methanoplasma sp.]
MLIRWHGHACFEFEDSGVTVLTDPHDGKSIGIKPPVSSAGVVLVSHNQYDHNAVRVVRGEHEDVVAEPGKRNIRGIDIEGFSTFHDEEGGTLRGSNVMYRFEMDGISVCHCGDLGDIPSDETMDELKGTDIVFVPVGEVYTIPLPKLLQFLERIGAKVVVPMHYRVGGLTIPLNNIDAFMENVPKEAAVYVGNEVELSAEDLAEFSGVWVFDR